MTSKMIIISARRLHRPPITIHIMNVYDESYLKIMTGLKYKTTTKTKTQTKCLKNPTFNPDDLLIPNMMIDISPWSSCSCQSPWLPCFGHTISSTGPFRVFLFDRQVSLTNQHAQIPDEPEGRAALLCHPPLPQGGQKS